MDFFLRPGDGPAGCRSARLLLDDMSLVSHGLGAHEVASGRAFAASVPDPGFHVTSFLLDTGGIARDVDGQRLTGTLRYRGRGEIWPPGVTQPEGRDSHGAVGTRLAAARDRNA